MRPTPDQIATQRESAFEQLRGTTLDVLDSQEVSEQLGEVGYKIIAALEASAVAQPQNGVILFPDEKREDARLRIYPVLPRERHEPTWRAYDLLYTDDREFLAQNHPYFDKNIHKEASRQKGWLRSLLQPQNFSPATKAAFEAIPDATGQAYQVIFSRPFVIAYMKWLQHTPSTIVAAVVAHEVDHAIKIQELAPTHGLAHYPSREEVIKEMRKFITYMEKCAYDITAKIISVRNSPDVMLGAFISEISGLSPNEAGIRLDKLSGTHRHEQVYRRALSALALAEVFGDESPLASDDEVIAFSAADLITF